MTQLRHKTFVGPTWYVHGGSLNENREVIRAEAEAFVNRVGVERVVSVAEHAMSWGPFSVVVWYRAPASESDADAVVQITNATIGRGLKALAEQRVAAADEAPTPDSSAGKAGVVVAVAAGIAAVLAALLL